MSNAVECPYCNATNTDLWELHIKEGSTGWWNCDSCGDDFEVKCIDWESGLFESLALRTR